MKSRQFLFLLSLVIVGQWPLVVCADTLYVDDDAPAGGDGLSWPTAMAHLQDALTVAADAGNGITEIRVAQGTYFPDTTEADPDGTGNRHASFHLIDSVAIDGGYAGIGASDPNQRDVEQFESILSGDLAENDLPDFQRYQDNSYHIVRALALADTASIDGFTVQSGSANFVDFPDRTGSALFIEDASPGVSNLTVQLNFAQIGAIYVGGDSSPQLADCTVRLNLGEGGGGMLLDSDEHITIVNCEFSQNAGGAGGGAGVCQSEVITFSNCDFFDNVADETNQPDGGALFISGGMVDFTNCTFERNLVEQGLGRGGALFLGSQALCTMVQCRFLENVASFGGAILHDGRLAPLVLIECEFNSNVADDSVGGAIHTGAHLVAIRSTFVSNEAPDRGSAIYIHDGEPLIYACRFVGNLGPGGALHTRTNAKNEWVINSIFHDNDTGLTGARNVLNCTIVHNRDHGLHQCERVYNTILWGNADGTEGSQASGQDLDLRHCLVENWSGQLGGFGNFGGDPRFTGRAGIDGIIGTIDDDVTPGALSAAIDAGNDFLMPRDMTDDDNDGDFFELLPLDFFGNIRCMDDRGVDDSGKGAGPVVDVGAIERTTNSPRLQSLIDFDVVYGTLIDGDLSDLMRSDDHAVDVQSEFGFSVTEANLAEIVIGSQNSLANPTSLMFVVEARLNNPGGTTRLRLFNWSDSEFQDVDSWPLGFTELVHYSEGIPAVGYVSSENRVEVALRVGVVSTFSATGFRLLVDQVEVRADAP